MANRRPVSSADAWYGDGYYSNRPPVRRKKRFRLKGRFFLFLFVLLAMGAAVLWYFFGGTKKGEIRYGEVRGTIQGSACIVRDEVSVSTDKYEKVTYMFTEGDTVQNGETIAKVYKRGYQEENIVSLLLTQREILEYQRTLMDEETAEGLRTIEAQIDAVEAKIRDTAREETDAGDMLELEQNLKELQQQRISYMAARVVPDANLNALYNSLSEQQATQSGWTRNIVNNGTAGIITFYFDGYEKVLNAAQINNINAALINSITKGGNTASLTESSSEDTLCRLVQRSHWYLAIVTPGKSAMRTVAGELYNVTFDEYSDQVYQAKAIEPIVNAASVVNILEFTSDIGEFLNIRTVTVTVNKAASGTMVGTELIAYRENGTPYISVKSGDQLFEVEVYIMSADENNAVVKPMSSAYALASGQKVIKEKEKDEDDD